MGAVAGQWEIWHTLSGLQLHWSGIISFCYVLTRTNYHKTLYKISFKTWVKADLISTPPHSLIEKQSIPLCIHYQIIYLFYCNYQSVTLHAQFFLTRCSDFCATVRASEMSLMMFLAVTHSVPLWGRTPLFKIIYRPYLETNKDTSRMLQGLSKGD